MFDIGMTELLVIGVVALIVVGPKDLPGMFRTLGRFTAKARALGRDFTRAMNDAADQSGLNEATKGLKGLSNPKAYGLDKLTDAADRFEKWDPNKRSGTSEAKDEPKILDPDRAAAAKKINEAGAKAATQRMEREAAEAEADTPAKPAAKKPAAKKPAAKTPAAKKPAAKAAPKTAAKSTAKSGAAKPAAAKTAAKPAAKSSAKTAAKTTAKAPAKSTAKTPAKSATKAAPARKTTKTTPTGTTSE